MTDDDRKKKRQELFDRAVGGVIRQGGPSVDPITGSCSYLGADGRRCAAGHLMDDDQIERVIEMGYNGRPISTVAGALEDLAEELGEEVTFAAFLQDCHDNAYSDTLPDKLDPTYVPRPFMESFRGQALRLARANDLDTKVLEGGDR